MSDRLPTWTVEIGFTNSLGRLITFDQSLFDAADDVFGSGFTQFFDGPNDNVSANVASIEIVRGRDNMLSDMAAGQTTVVLNDPAGQAGYFNPQNTLSPLAAQSPGFVPMRPLRITATLGGTVYPVFMGYVRSASYERISDAFGRCTVTAVDLFLWLSRIKPRDAGQFTAATPTESGDAVTIADAQTVKTTGYSRTGLMKTA